FIISYKNGGKNVLRSGSSTSIQNIPGNIGNQNGESFNKKITTASSSSSIVYKVQMGAYRQKISDRSMIELRKMSPDVLSQETTSTGLLLCYSGSFTDLKS